MIKQHFEYIAVIDFEATCDTNQGNNYPHEIIEFPIVLINVQQQMIVIH
jgi:3'-5' exoribonuclease 1